jgi:hypothetical protein
VIVERTWRNGPKKVTARVRFRQRDPSLSLRFQCVPGTEHWTTFTVYCRWRVTGLITTLIVAALAVALSTPLASNAVLLLMEHSNVIPGES